MKRVLVMCGGMECAALLGCMMDCSSLIKNCSSLCSREQLFECTYLLDVALDENSCDVRKLVGSTCKHCPDPTIEKEEYYGDIAFLSS